MGGFNNHLRIGILTHKSKITVNVGRSRAVNPGGQLTFPPQKLHQILQPNQQQSLSKPKIRISTKVKLESICELHCCYD